MRQFTISTTESLRSLADNGPGGASEQPRPLIDRAAVITRRADSARRSFLGPGTPAGHRALAVGDEERVEQGLHRGPFFGIEQLRGFEGQFQTRFIIKSARPKDQLITGRRQRRGQLAQYAERGFGLARFIEADLVREHVEGLGECRLGQATLTAQRRQILRKTHATLYRLRSAYQYVILILSI